MPESTNETRPVCPWCSQIIEEGADTAGTPRGGTEHIDCWVEHCRTCISCSDTIDTDCDGYRTYDDDFYCDSCAEETLVDCDNCEQTVLTGDALYTQGNAYCEECHNEIFTECPNCEHSFRHEYGATVQHDEEEWWCESCVNDHSRVCDACHIRTSEGNSHLSGDGFNICTLCCNDDEGPADFRICRVCEGWYHVANLNEVFTCYNCLGIQRNMSPGRREEGRRVRPSEPRPVPPREFINNYSFKPPPIFRTAAGIGVVASSPNWFVRRNRNLYYGIELEVTCRSYKRGDAMHSWVEADPNQLWYFKSDASVSEGFEAVSHPFHFEWLKANLEEFVAPIEASSPFTRGYTYTSAGMHVHMSRDAFSTLHLMKFCRFFYNNPGFIMQMSRRPPQCIFSYGDPWMDAQHERLLARSLSTDGGMRLMSRNTAINLNNRQTIECRIFRSTTTRSGVVANIEFLHGAYNFTKQASMSDLNPGLFLDWMSQSKKDFPFFNEVLLPRAGVGIEGGE